MNKYEENQKRIVIIMLDFTSKFDIVKLDKALCESSTIF